MAREPRIVLEFVAIVAVWVLALLGCKPGDTRHAADADAADKAPVSAAPVEPTEPDAAATDAAAPAAAATAAADDSQTVDSALADEPSDGDSDLPRNSLRDPDAVPPANRVAESAFDEGEQAADPNILFENWPQPEFVFFISGQQHGYIEPCGCTGLQNQKGGMARRHSLAGELKERGWPLLALDAGNQVRRVGVQAELKFQMTLAGMNTIGYDAITLGADDLRMSIGELVAATADLEGQSSPFINANVAVLDRSLTPRYRVVERGGRKIGVTAVIGDKWISQVNSDEIVTEPVAPALKEVAAILEKEQCDLYVLLAHADLDESRNYAEQFPLFDIVVTAGGVGDPTFRPEFVGQHKAMLVQVGVKGMYVGIVGVFADGDPLRYQRVPLDARFADSEPMLQLLASYQRQLEELGLPGLGVKPLPHPTGRQFVGSEKCGECHTTAFEIWEGTPHAHATESLVHPGERSEIARHFDPECLSCHVTGWNPQRFYPYTSGYLSLEGSPLMHASGCENCHGPGSEHVAAEEGSVDLTEEAQLARRVAMRLPLSRAELHCMECHDLDNSPDLHDEGAFDKYWKQVEHWGVD